MSNDTSLRHIESIYARALYAKRLNGEHRRVERRRGGRWKSFAASWMSDLIHAQYRMVMAHRIKSVRSTQKFNRNIYLPILQAKFGTHCRRNSFLILHSLRHFSPLLLPHRRVRLCDRFGVAKFATCAFGQLGWWLPLALARKWHWIVFTVNGTEGDKRTENGSERRETTNAMKEKKIHRCVETQPTRIHEMMVYTRAATVRMKAKKLLQYYFT